MAADVIGVAGNKHKKTPILLKYDSYFFPLFWFKRIIYSTPYMNGRATTRGVFKAYVVFFVSNNDNAV